MKVILLLCIKAYRKTISRYLPPACRFTPTCSEYAQQAIERHGARRGAWMAAKRLVRCHPWGESGYDPVK